MRIAFIHPFLYRYPRGIERFLINLANGMVRHGADVHILTWRWPNQVTSEALDSQVVVHQKPAIRYFAARAIIPFYVGDLLRHSYDFVWVFFGGYGEREAIILTSYLRRIRYGISLHFPATQVPHRYQELARFRFANRANAIVSVSQFVADGLKQTLNLESTVIPNPVDTVRFRPDPQARAEMRRRLALDPQSPLLLTVAALEERKGVQHVLNALPMVIANHPLARYVVLGEGPYRPVLEERVRALGLEKNVTLAGSRQDVLPYYQSADLFLLLSHGEASPLSPMEAMSARLPVIAARQRPFDEIINQSTGILVPEHDAPTVAGVINDLLADSPRLRSMGAAARDRVLAVETWSQVAERYLNLSR